MFQFRCWHLTSQISSFDNPNYCYFTLSPEQEAAQAAQHLTSLGHQYPLFLAPSGAYGTRITQAFQQKWDELNSTSSDVEYFGSQHQLQRNVNKVFGLTDSQARIAQMSNLLGTGARSGRKKSPRYRFCLHHCQRF